MREGQPRPIITTTIAIVLIIAYTASIFDGLNQVIKSDPINLPDIKKIKPIESRYAAFSAAELWHRFGYIIYEKTVYPRLCSNIEKQSNNSKFKMCYF